MQRQQRRHLCPLDTCSKLMADFALHANLESKAEAALSPVSDQMRPVL